MHMLGSIRPIHSRPTPPFGPGPARPAPGRMGPRRGAAACAWGHAAPVGWAALPPLPIRGTAGKARWAALLPLPPVPRIATRAWLAGRVGTSCGADTFDTLTRACLDGGQALAPPSYRNASYRSASLTPESQHIADPDIARFGGRHLPLPVRRATRPAQSPGTPERVSSNGGPHEQGGPNS